MNKLQQEIVMFLYEEEQRTGNIYMDKSLSFGCYLKRDFLTHWGYAQLHTRALDGSSWKVGGWSELFYDKETEKTKILGHYDMTAVLKYIHIEIGNIWLKDSEIFEVYDGNKHQNNYIGFLWNKPLHLYSDEENKHLLKLLKETGNN